MKLKTFLCIMAAVCIIPSLALAADKKETSKSALQDLKAVEKSSKEASKDAQAGKLESAKEKSGRGFDTPVKSTDTVKSQPVTRQDPKVKSQPVTREDPKEISRRENEAQKERDRKTAQKYKLDDPKKAPPKP